MTRNTSSTDFGCGCLLMAVSLFIAAIIIGFGLQIGLGL